MYNYYVSTQNAEVVEPHQNSNNSLGLEKCSIVRARVAVFEGQGLIPTTWWFPTVYNSSSGGLAPSAGLCWHGLCMVHRYMQTKHTPIPGQFLKIFKNSGRKNSSSRENIILKTEIILCLSDTNLFRTCPSQD